MNTRILFLRRENTETYQPKDFNQLLIALETEFHGYVSISDFIGGIVFLGASNSGVLQSCVERAREYTQGIENLSVTEIGEEEISERSSPFTHNHAHNRALKFTTTTD